MGIGDFIKNKVNDGKKSTIKSRIKKTIKSKIDVGDKMDSKIDSMLDNAIEKVGANNIINAKKIYDDVTQKNNK